MYGRPRSPQPLLFYLPDDPHERRDLSSERPEVLAQRSAMLEQWREGMLAASGSCDPILDQGLSMPYERFMERLFGRKRSDHE